MKNYTVSWLERHEVNVEAENEEEAIEKIEIGDFNEMQDVGELDGEIKAVEYIQ